MAYLDRPWLKSYKLGPYHLDHSLAPLPRVPVYQILYEAAEKFPGQTAVLFQGRKISYRDMRCQVDQLSTALAGLGVKKGDRVCLFLPNCTEFILSDWAVMRAGATVVPTSVLRSDEGLLHELSCSSSRVIFCREENLDRVLGIRDQCEIGHIIVISRQGYDVQEVASTLPPNVHDFRRLLSAAPADPPQLVMDPQVDLCELAFTGGATGTPKGAMITHSWNGSVLGLGVHCRNPRTAGSATFVVINGATVLTSCTFNSTNTKVINGALLTRGSKPFTANNLRIKLKTSAAWQPGYVNPFAGILWVEV